MGKRNTRYPTFPRNGRLNVLSSPGERGESVGERLRSGQVFDSEKCLVVLEEPHSVPFRACGPATRDR